MFPIYAIASCWSISIFYLSGSSTNRWSEIRCRYASLILTDIRWKGRVEAIIKSACSRFAVERLMNVFAFRCRSSQLPHQVQQMSTTINVDHVPTDEASTEGNKTSNWVIVSPQRSG